MAVQIIGEAPEVLKEAKCRGCGALLRYGDADVTSFTDHDYGGGSDTVWQIECPRCHKKIRVGR